MSLTIKYANLRNIPLWNITLNFRTYDVLQNTAYELPEVTQILLFELYFHY